ncbi:MAG TPA: hypothetical protein VLG69_03970 [Candidatus Andersenbacteria bacterium]|nr:hypothetical protein [Candidatus Andersenbacteria bacterium]
MLQKRSVNSIDVSDLPQEIADALYILVEAIRVQDYNKQESVRRSKGILQKKGRTLRPVTRDEIYGDIDEHLSYK